MRSVCLPACLHPICLSFWGTQMHVYASIRTLYSTPARPGSCQTHRRRLTVSGGALPPPFGAARCGPQPPGTARGRRRGRATGLQDANSGATTRIVPAAILCTAGARAGGWAIGPTRVLTRQRLLLALLSFLILIIRDFAVTQVPSACLSWASLRPSGLWGRR